MATETTLIDAHEAAPSAGGFYIVWLSATGAVTFPISPRKRLLVGRSRRADVQLDDPLASREHARLEAGDENSVVVVDLGSANGTRFRGVPVAPHARQSLRSGESIEIGSSVLLLLRQRAGVEQRRVWSHQYFEAKLAEACQNASAVGGPLGILRARFDEDVSSARVLPILLEECGTGVLATYEPREFELLLEGEDPETVRARLASRFEGAGVAVRFGLSRFPRDGQSAHSLFDRANPHGRPGPFPELSDATVSDLDTAMAQVVELAKRVAPSNITVLLQGETGVGKEVMTSNIHRWSSRSGPLVCVNCAGLSESLLESELFGHERGAFTGASQKVGLLESANGGTVLLDEIGELPLGLQPKLLRMLQDRSVRRVGGVREIALDVRFVAATNRDLEAQAAAGAFRQDLFFRLSAATIVIPPLRERRSEIAALALGFVSELARALSPPQPLGVSPEALKALTAYGWPGNIRELKNMLERAVLLCSGDRVELRHLPAEKLRAAPLDARQRATSDTPPDGLSALQIGERQRIVAALDQCAWNQTSAAAVLGMPRRTLVSKLKAYGIPRPRGARGEASPPRSSRPGS